MITNDFWQKVTKAIPLGKQRAYITLPILSSAFTWRGVPTIVAEYQYAATNNFTLSNIPAKLSDCNFTLCIKYRISNTVYRYKIWATEGQLDEVPLYSGQIVKKNFTFELWSSASNSPVINTAATKFYLSILQSRATLADADTYSNCDASSLINQAGLVNTNLPVAGIHDAARGPIEPTEISSLNNFYVDIVDSIAEAPIGAGHWTLAWLGGVYKNIGGMWLLGIYGLYDSTNTLITTFGNEDSWISEALAKANNANYRFDFNLAVASTLTIKLIANDPANTDGTPTPSFQLLSTFSLPLIYITTQHGITN